MESPESSALCHPMGDKDLNSKCQFTDIIWKSAVFQWKLNNMIQDYAVFGHVIS